MSGAKAYPPPLAGEPLRDDSVTIRPCPACGRSFHARGRARFCSQACRQRAYRERRRQALPRTAARDLPALYECPACGERLLGERRCPDCNLFCRNLGPGGLCPHCEEPVAFAELLA